MLLESAMKIRPVQARFKVHSVTWLMSVLQMELLRRSTPVVSIFIFTLEVFFLFLSLFPAISLTRTASTAATKTNFRTKDCTGTGVVAETITKTCGSGDGRQLYGCTSSPFDYGTTLSMVAET
jgi:hypothetical protein